MVALIMAASYGLVWTVATVEDFQRLMAYWAAHGRVSSVVAECNRLAEIYPHQLDGGASQAWDDYCEFILVNAKWPKARD
jgi:hypothetical protein